MNNSFTAKQIADSMKAAIRTTQDHEFCVSLGIEAEFFAFDKETHQPVDLLKCKQLLGQLHKDQSRYLWLGKGRDLGKNMMELAFQPVQSLQEYIGAVCSVFCWLAKNEVSKKWYFVFGDNPDDSLGYDDKNPRYQDLLNAVINPGELIDQMINFGSFQINVGVEDFGGFKSEEAKQLMRVLNNWAPALALNAEYASRTEMSQRLPRAYTNFAEWNRVPHYMFIHDALNFKEYITTVPHLLINDDNGSGAGNGEHPTSFKDVDTTFIWWDARPRHFNGHLKTKRVEFRTLTIMPPHRSIYILSWFNGIVRSILSGDELYTLSENDWNLVRSKGDGAREIAKNFLGDHWLDDFRVDGGLF